MIRLIALLMLLTTKPAWALIVETPLARRADEARAHILFRELRCVVCQGEAIADSPALVAVDMRRTIREQLYAGKQEDEIKAFFVEKYGERVLMKPALTAKNFLLWAAPLLFLASGLIFAWRRLFKGNTHD